jgi:hypothetical protein
MFFYNFTNDSESKECILVTTIEYDCLELIFFREKTFEFVHFLKIKMLGSKPLLSTSNLHLPTLPKPNRHRFRSSSPLSLSSIASTNIPENVSALKAKYTDYAMWLKASSKQNRDPIFTHELLKHSLCEMGIDTTQAEQLVSTCSWYVYQFQKELGVDTEQADQSIMTEAKKSSQSSERRHKKIRTTKSKKTIPLRDHSMESVTTINSINKG